MDVVQKSPLNKVESPGSQDLGIFHLVPAHHAPQAFAALGFASVRPSEHLTSLIHAKTLIEQAQHKFAPTIGVLLNGTLSIHELPAKKSGPLFTGEAPTGNEAILLIEIARKTDQEPIAQALGIAKSYRTRLGTAFADLAFECRISDVKNLRNEVRNLDSAIAYHRWSEWMTPWLRSGGEVAAPESAQNVPLYFLDGNPHINDRIYRALRRRTVPDSAGNLIVNLSPFKHEEFLGIEVGSAHGRVGRFILAVKDPKSEKVRHLHTGSVTELKGKLPVRLDHVGGAAAELTRFAVGAGPVDFDLAFSRRQIVEAAPPYVDILSDVAKIRVDHLRLPAYALKSGYTRIQPVTPKSTLSHFVKHGSLAGSSLWMRAFPEDPDQRHPGELVSSVAIHEISGEAIRFKTKPLGTASRTQNRGVRILLGRELREYLKTGEGEAPQYSPIRAIRSATVVRAPRIRFAGQDFSLSRGFTGDMAVPKVLTAENGTRVIAFFEREAPRHTLESADLILKFDAETEKLGVWRR